MRPCLLVIFALAGSAPETRAADRPILLRGGTLYDGTGGPGVVGDVLLTGDRITAVGVVKPPQEVTVIECTGLAVCPGFIDLHTHCDTGSPTLTAAAGRPNACYVHQGVTTVVTGNCGSGPVEVAGFFAKLTDGGVATNVVHQVPHNSVREKVMGNANRTPTADELAKMEALVETAMQDGAFGFATGLIYNPGTYAKTSELIALAKVTAKHGGHYASHIRNEGGGLLDAIQEAITIGKESGCPVHISHIKASGRAAAGLAGRAVGLIETARAAGLKVTADQYPYIASSTSLRATLVPSRYREGSTQEYVARYTDPSTGPKLKADLEAAIKERDDGRAIQIARYSANPKWQGQRISQIATAEGKSPLDVVIDIETHGGAQIVNFGMTEEDVRIYMKQPWVATASDGSTQVPGATVPHPRSYGTFSRKIGRYSIEEKTVPVAFAVRSASGLPADILRLTDRGYLTAGKFADVVVFDPTTYRDAATYEKPHQLTPGVRHLFVNGRAVIAEGKHDPAVLAGRVLRRTPSNR